MYCTICNTKITVQTHCTTQPPKQQSIMSVDINGYSIDVVGINMPCQGRNCAEHPDGCGRQVLHVGVVLRIEKQTIMVHSKEEVMLGVFLIVNGIDSCKVGFLPRFLSPGHQFLMVRWPRSSRCMGPIVLTNT